MGCGDQGYTPPPPPFGAPNTLRLIPKFGQDYDLPSLWVLGLVIKPDQPPGSMNVPPHVGHDFYFGVEQLPPSALTQVRHIFPVEDLKLLPPHHIPVRCRGQE